MGFEDAPTWRKWLFLCLILAIAHILYVYSAIGFGGFSTGAEACLVLGYLCVMTATVLAMAILLTEDLKENKPALICCVVFSLLGGILVIIGFAFMSGDNSRAYRASGGHWQGTLTVMLGVMGGLFSILAGIFGILDLVGVGAK